jgi:hypothetical protein
MHVLLLLVQVWAELLVLLAEGEMEAQPWDQERYRPLLLQLALPFLLQIHMHILCPLSGK